MRNLFACLTIMLALSGCSDSCQEYSKYSCSELDNLNYNVLFYFPDGNKEYHLGVAHGLSQCGSIAHNFAGQKNLDRSSGWSYVCCLKTENSECQEKHR